LRPFHKGDNGLTQDIRVGSFAVLPLAGNSRQDALALFGRLLDLHDKEASDQLFVFWQVNTGAKQGYLAGKFEGSGFGASANPFGQQVIGAVAVVLPEKGTQNGAGDAFAV